MVLSVRFWYLLYSGMYKHVHSRRYLLCLLQAPQVFLIYSYYITLVILCQVLKHKYFYYLYFLLWCISCSPRQTPTYRRHPKETQHSHQVHQTVAGKLLAPYHSAVIVNQVLIAGLALLVVCTDIHNWWIRQSAP